MQAPPTVETAPASTRSPHSSGESRYFDALLTDMDRHIKPDITGERGKFLYEAVRRVLVRFVAEGGHRRAPDDLGLGQTPDWAAMSDADALGCEGDLLDQVIARGDARVALVAAAQDAPTVTREALQNALRRLGHRNAAVTSMRIVVGGRSKQTILFSADGVSPWPSDLVMRRDMLVGSLGTSVVNEFALLRLLHRQGVQVPKTFHLEEDHDVIGTPFLLMQAVAGAMDGNITAAPASREKVLAAARSLAQIQRIPPDTMAPALLHLGEAATRETMAAEIERWHSTWRAQARSRSVSMEAAFRYLRDHVHAADMSPSFVHGDYSFHNILYHGDSLTAVLDWELAHIGHAAEDLGYIKQAVQSTIPWTDFMLAYQDAGGAAVSADALRFYGLFGQVRLLMKVFIARQLFEEGRTDDILKADVALFWLPRIVHQISREMREIAAEPPRNPVGKAAGR